MKSLIYSFDQFQLISENQFVSLRDQLWVLSEASGIERSSALPLQPVRTPGVEQVKVIEGLGGKMKGLKQTILTERIAVKGL